MVLIADDEPDLKDLLQLQLESMGCRVLTAFDGLDTLSIASLNLPNLILLDVMMPVMDGFEVCRSLKADDRTKHIPVVFLSAATHTDTVKKGMNCGADDYLTKPVSPTALENLIKRYTA